MTIVTLYPTADAELVQGAPTTNYGTATVVYICPTTGNLIQNLLKFNISSIPVDATINSATLRVNCDGVYQLVGGVTDVQARKIADDTWTELGVTWNNQPTAGDVMDTIVPSVAWKEWNVLSYIQVEYAGDKIVSILMRCVNEGYDANNRWSSWKSRESDGGAYKPELVIDYTEAPEETGITLDNNPIDVISWKETQECKVAKRNTPLRTNGTIIDEKIFTLKARIIEITIRLTDAEITSLLLSFNSNTLLTLEAIDDSGNVTWTYTVWFRNKPIVYEYAKRGNGNIKEWRADLELICSEFPTDL